MSLELNLQPHVSHPKGLSRFFLPILALVIMVMPLKHQLTFDTIMMKIHSDDRVNAWCCFYKMLEDHPVTGIGFGMQTYYDETLLNKYNERVPAKYKQATPLKAPHNLVVDIAVRVGVIGFLLFFYIIFAFARMSWSIIKPGRDDFIRHWGVCFCATFVAIFIQGQFENIWWGSPIIILFAIWAMTAILWRINKRLEAS